MQTIIVASIVLIALGAFATFAMVELLPDELLAQSETHGRFTGLGDDQAVPTHLPGTRRSCATRKMLCSVLRRNGKLGLQESFVMCDRFIAAVRGQKRIRYGD